MATPACLLALPGHRAAWKACLMSSHCPWFQHLRHHDKSQQHVLRSWPNPLSLAPMCRWCHITLLVPHVQDGTLWCGRSHRGFVETVPESSLAGSGRAAGPQGTSVSLFRDMLPGSLHFDEGKSTPAQLLSGRTWNSSQTNCIDMILFPTLAELSSQTQRVHTLSEWDFGMLISCL